MSRFVEMATEADTGEAATAAAARAVLDFDAFYATEYPRMVRLLAASTGRIALAEELAQDAFLAAHRRWSRVVTLDDPGGWVRRVALNAATSAWRRRRNEAAALLRLQPDRRPGAGSVTEIDEPLDDRVWTAVRDLPSRQARVLLLAGVEDRSVADIAAILDLSPNSVRTHLRRARARLAAELGVDEGGPT